MVDPEVRISAIAVAEDLTSDYVEMAEASTSQSATSCKTAPSASNTPTAPAPASPCHRRAIIVSTHPGQGTVKRWKQISGNYYQVNPLCLRSKISVLTDNARCVVWISTGEFCEVFFVAIDATYVGTVDIHNHYKTPGNQIRKGEEVGIFEFGCSSIVVVYEKGRISTRV